MDGFHYRSETWKEFWAFSGLKVFHFFWAQLKQIILNYLLYLAKFSKFSKSPFGHSKLNISVKVSVIKGLVNTNNLRPA